MLRLSEERLDELEAGYKRQAAITLKTRGWAHVLCNAEDVLALIAMARGKQAAERERDALLAVALEVWGFLEIDRCAPDCAWRKEVRERLAAALAQHTNAGGAE